MSLPASMFARPNQCIAPLGQRNNAFVNNSAPSKVRTIQEAARDLKHKVPDMLAAESRSLSAFAFAALMLAVEEEGHFWFESERFFVFCNQSGVVSSVWLGGREVYNAIW